MSERVAAALRATRILGERRDPTLPLAVGAIADELGLTLSSASRLCAELGEVGLLERADGYGTYRLGPAALRLSGQAARPFARSVREALTIAGHATGETVCLAAAAVGGMRIVAAIPTAWTLFSAAEVGELVTDPSSAILRAASGHVGAAEDARHFRSTIGRSVEVATPLLGPAGECMAVLAVRLPVNRAQRGVPQARRALTEARHRIERCIGAMPGTPPMRGVPAERDTPTALVAAMRVLFHLTEGVDTVAGIAAATGLRHDRTQRIIDSCRSAGLVEADGDDSCLRLSWGVHGWHRAAASPLMTARGTSLVARVADETGACAFITVLHGLRSVTLVEELEVQGEGLRMTPWLGRPCPLPGADGGPTLVMDFPVDELAALLPRRHPQSERDEFLDRVRQVSRDGVLAKESFEEAGLISISAPIRDSSGIVVGAACIVGASDRVRPRLRSLTLAAKELARGLSALLAGAEAPMEPAARAADRRDGG